MGGVVVEVARPLFVPSPPSLSPFSCLLFLCGFASSFFPCAGARLIHRLRPYVGLVNSMGRILVFRVCGFSHTATVAGHRLAERALRSSKGGRREVRRRWAVLARTVAFRVLVVDFGVGGFESVASVGRVKSFCGHPRASRADPVAQRWTMWS